MKQALDTSCDVEHIRAMQTALAYVPEAAQLFLANKPRVVHQSAHCCPPGPNTPTPPHVPSTPVPPASLCPSQNLVLIRIPGCLLDPDLGVQVGLARGGGHGCLHHTLQHHLRAGTHAAGT